MSHEGGRDTNGTHGTQRQNERVPESVPINANGVIELDTRGHVGHVGHVKKDVNEFALESINEKTSTRAHASLESINEDYGGLSRDDAEAAARAATSQCRRHGIRLMAPCPETQAFAIKIPVSAGIFRERQRYVAR